jgi:hypothetical protein
MNALKRSAKKATIRLKKNLSDRGANGEVKAVALAAVVVMIGPPLLECIGGSLRRTRG